MKSANKSAPETRTTEIVRDDYADSGPAEDPALTRWGSEAVLAAIIESSDDAIISKDLNGIIRSWNGGAERIFGYTAGEAIGRPVSMLAVPERVGEMPTILDRIRRGEKVDRYETKRRTKDGRVLDISLTVYPIRDAAGQIIGASKVARDITAQKHAVLVQERLAAIVESSDDAIISKDLNGIIRSWNSGAERIFGYTAEEAVGQPVSMLAVPERVEEIPSIIERIRRGEKVDHYVTKRRTKDGRILDISLTVSPIRDAAGQIIGASKVARDITDLRRRAELQERLAAIVESSEDAIISKDLNGLIQSWNKGAERIFGYTAAEAIGQPVSMLAVPERVQEMPNIIDHIRRGERVEHFQTKRQTKDGRVLDISLTVSPIRDASGAIIGASKIARDITEQRRDARQKEQLLLREKELRETAELLNQIGPTLVTELNPDNLAQKITDSATRLAGAEFGALFRNAVNDKGESYVLYTVSGVEREAFSRFPMPRNTPVFAPTFRGHGPVRSDDITKDPRYGQNPPYNGMPKGHLPVRSYLAVPVISRSGEVLAGLFFGHSQPGRFDEWHERIVAGVAAQAAIALDNARLFSVAQTSRESAERTNQELRRANADLEQFAFSASHDLKEPLRMVAIYSQIVQRRYGAVLDSEGVAYLENIVNGARRMDKLVQDLLAYTKSSDSSLAEVRTPVSAGNVLRQVTMSLARSIEETGTRIECGDLPALLVSEVHLVQLFQNIIENAIKYRDQEPPRIRIEAAREGELWRICIHDNGIGIAPEYREQVFGIFKRLHTSDKYSGTGIGLAICQRLVARYGGRIWVESSGEGKGTSFCFTLPGRELNS